MKSNPDPGSPVVEYQMGYGADEFGKVLNGPFSGDTSPYECRELARHRWSVEQPGEALELTIDVSQQPPRKLGLFNLPVLDVSFSFGATDAALREGFFRRFHQYFHKGGG
jgi:hypothetical protein